jgi:predicted TIM-barrel fold metal-dependent hydrolase
MIVDVHTHLPTHRDIVPDSELAFESAMRSGDPTSRTNSIADYLRAMEPVDRTLAFGIAPRPWIKDRDLVFKAGDMAVDGKNHNDVAAELHRAAPDKVIPFMSLHPMDPGMNDEYDRAVGDLGCKGIKLGPNYQDFDPVGEDAFKLYARLEADNLPIVFHQGTSPMQDAPLRYAQPLVMDQVAIAFPDLKIVMAHLGHPWHNDCLAVVRKHPNVWADVSAQFYRPWSFWNGMQLFYEWGVTQKILFASDWPVTVPQDNIDGLRNLSKFAKDHHLPVIPEDEIEGIINRDALEILGVG